MSVLQAARYALKAVTTRGPGTVEARQAIRAGIAASAVAHLSVLMLVLFSEVHPFGAVTAEPIAVDIVTAEEVAQKKL